MRYRYTNKDTGVLGTAALDLFASALGAFILVSVVLLPFFPNTSLSESELSAKLESLREESERKDAERIELLESTEQMKSVIADLEKELAVIRQSISDTENADKKRIDLPDLDIVIAIDVTNSMFQPIEGLKKEIRQLVTILEKLTPSLGIGIVAYGDRIYVRPTHSFPLRQVKASDTSMSALQAFMDQLEPGMKDLKANDNRDLEEALGLAMRQAIASEWRSESTRRMVVLLADSPAYPEEQTRILRVAKQFSAEQQGNSISTVFIPTDERPGVQLNQDAKKRLIDNSQAARRYLGDLALAGQGRAVQSGESMTADLLYAILF